MSPETLRKTLFERGFEREGIRDREVWRWESGSRLATVEVCPENGIHWIVARRANSSGTFKTVLTDMPVGLLDLPRMLTLLGVEER